MPVDKQKSKAFLLFLGLRLVCIGVKLLAHTKLDVVLVAKAM